MSPVDYRSFLAPAGPGVDPVVLPYLGGPRVDAPDRRLRVVTPSQAG